MAGGKGGKRKLGRNKVWCGNYRSMNVRGDNAKKRRVRHLKGLVRKLKKLKGRGNDVDRLVGYIREYKLQFNLE